MSITPENLPPEYNPGKLSPSDIRDVVSGAQTGAVLRDCNVRLYDRNLNAILVSGAPDDDINSLGGFNREAQSRDAAIGGANRRNHVQACSVDINTTREVAGSCTVVTDEVPGLRYDPFQHIIRVFAEYFGSSREKLLSIPLITAQDIIPDKEISDQIILLKSDAGDLSFELFRQPFKNVYTVPEGSSFTDFVKSIAQMDCLVPNDGGRVTVHPGLTPAGCDCPGVNIPAERLDIPDCTQHTYVDIPFDLTTILGVGCNQLLVPVNMWPLFMDALGGLTTRFKPFYTDDTPIIGWTFTDDPDDRRKVIIGSVNKSFPDKTQLGNSAQVFCEPAGKPALFGYAKNKNPSSPVSIPVQQREILLPAIRDDNIPDAPATDIIDTITLRALITAQRAAMLAEQLDFTTLLIPFLSPHMNLDVEIRKPQSTALEIFSGVNPFEVDSYSFDLSNWTGTVSCSRVVVLG